MVTKEKTVMDLTQSIEGLTPDLAAVIEGAKAAWEAKDGQRLSREYAERERRNRINWIYNNAGMTPEDREKRFENYEVESGSKKAYDLLRQYSQDWPESGQGGHGVIVMGSFGVGKTHLCLAAMNEIILNHEVVCEYANVKVTLDFIKETYDSEGINPVPRLIRRELLFLDDLGSERPTTWTLDAISSIVTFRYQKYLPTLYTTNATSWSELVEFLAAGTSQLHDAERLVERILERNIAAKVMGNSNRKPLAR